MVRHNDDFSIEVDQHAYVKQLKRIHLSAARRSQGNYPLTPKELHEYRSLAGQLAWPARETMPPLAFTVSDLQQRVGSAIVSDIALVNSSLKLALELVANNQKLYFPVLPGLQHQPWFTISNAKSAKKTNVGKRNQQRWALESFKMPALCNN